MKLAVGVGLLATLAFHIHQFPVATYSIGGPSIDYISGKPVQMRWDVVLVTRYFDAAGVVITTQHIYKARIDCLNISIQPATMFQSCRQSRDANKI